MQIVYLFYQKFQFNSFNLVKKKIRNTDDNDQHLKGRLKCQSSIMLNTWPPA